MANPSATLSAPGPRTVVDEETAGQILAQWENQLAESDATITTLDLQCRPWPAATLEVFRPLLTRLAPSIKVLQLDDIIASLQTEAGLATLGFFADVFAESPLEALYLSDNALGIRGCDILRPLITRPSMQHLYFNNCGMSKEVADVFLETLDTTAPHLRSIGLGRNQMGAEGAARLGDLVQRCERLQTLDYFGSRPLKAGTLALCKGLAACVGAGHADLRELDLNDANFGSGEEEEQDGILPLCEAIRGSPNLEKLIVTDGELEAEGVTRLLEALTASGAKLRYLDMGCLEIAAEGAEALAEYCQSVVADSLEELHLETNELEDEGTSILMPALVSCTKLRVLNLSENAISTDGFQAIIDNRIPNLQKLVLRGNDDEVQEQEDVIEQLRSLYPVVILDDDDEEPAVAVGAAAEQAIDDLADMLGSAQI